MKTQIYRSDPQAVQRSIDAAIAAGTHSRTCLRYCDGCGDPAESLWYVTIDRKNLCGACADKIGQGPQTLARRRAEQVLHVMAQREVRS